MSEQASAKTLRIVIAIFVAVSFVAVLTVNALANILPLNNVGTGTLSDEIPNLFVPAGLTFSVWGLIYLLLAVYSATIVAQAFRASGEAWQPMDGLLFIVNALANVAWIFSWHWRVIPLSMLMMLVILGTLVAMEERNYRKFGTGGTLLKSGKTGRFGRFALTVPINVYLGWISVATIANVTALLVTAKWNGFGIDPRIWTFIVILAGFAVALGLILRRGAAAAPMVVVWAYIGIVLKRSATDPEYSSLIWISAGLAAAAIMIILVIRAAKSLKSAKA